MSTKILLVDSIASYRTKIALQLKQRGFGVVETENGKKALEALRQDAFDLVIVDNDLPNQRGLDLISRIRDFDKSVLLMLVIDPFDGQPDNESIAKKNGVSKVVRGPLSPGAMVQQVKLLLSEADKAPPSSETTSLPKAPAVLSSRRAASGQFTDEESLSVHVKAVRRAYQKKLPDEIAKLGRALEEAHKNPKDTSALEAVHAITHALHGTSGTLGFDEISELTGYLDAEIKKMISGHAASIEEWDTIFRVFKRAQTVPERLSLVVSVEPHTNNIATILVADPDKVSLMSISKVAHKRCIDVRGAETLEEVMELAEMGRVDGAIVDVDFESKMPIAKVVERIRSAEGMAGIPVAMMSKNCSVEDRVAAAHAGASQFLSKPINADEFTEVVQDLVSSRANQNHRVLIVDDDESFREHIAAILKEEGFQVITLGDPRTVLDTAEATKPDVILLDVMMPNISGFDVCRMLRSTSTWKEIPILFLTAEADPKVRLECFRSGGDDYIKKPALKEELLARIGVRLERIRLYKERADRDALTALPTRRAFIEMFKIRIAEGLRYNRPASLCLLDIDHFKHVNDTYGHLTGDRVLATLGQLLGSRFRTVDIRGRWGGEEFTIVFFGEESTTSKMILTRLLDEFRTIEFKGEHDERFFCTFSCGIAELPKDGNTVEELFRVADERLYSAKEAGRNLIHTE
jgi:diguanylate cyclase (GGDEF)-like protein